ncbi:MAG TPA: HmuY family protein [Polyangiales bacterium]|jgi:hypothetical protein|nr:HmuY family protein [Polyangiales bacterium]
MRSTVALPLILSLSWCSVVACGDASVAEQRGEVICTDESFSKLALFSDKPNPAEVINDKEAQGFLTEIDVTAGGMSPTLPYVYLKFEDDGLKSVAITDEDAFESTDWDIAARRFVLRLNSGVSGPGQVKAARTAPKTEFDKVTAVPKALEFRAEEYFTESCDIIPDPSGIGSPGTALSSFWSYDACVAMTHNVYIISVDRPKARHVKLEVMAYYFPDRQEVCDETGMVPSPSGAGHLKLRWAFVD